MSLTDPSGHNWESCRAGKSDYQCKIHARKVSRLKNEWAQSTLESAIHIGFGKIDDDGKPIYGTEGLGTVLNNRNTIVTAYHILENAQNLNLPLSMYYEYEDKWNKIDMSMLDFSVSGDILIRTYAKLND